MSGRFNISNHRGINLKNRSSDFLEYGKAQKSNFTAVKSRNAMDQIRLNQKWDRWLRPLAVIISLLIFFVTTVLLKSVMIDNFPGTKKQVSIDYKEKQDQEILDMILGCGFYELERKNYNEAQREFLDFLEFRPNDIRAAIGLSTSLVARCELDVRFCESASLYIDYSKKISDDDFGLLYEGTLRSLENRIKNLPY